MKPLLFVLSIIRFQSVIENKKEAINVINEALKILNENQLKNEEIKIVKNNYTSLKQ